MKHHKAAIAFALIAGIVIFFYLGQNFDSRCGRSCLREAIARNSDAAFAKTFFLDSDEADRPEDFSPQWEQEIISKKEEEERNSKRQTLSKVVIFDPTRLDSISVKSYLTNWRILASVDERASLSLYAYLEPEEWKIDQDENILEIEIGKKGPLSAELRLPKDFQGNLSLNSEGGSLEIDDLARTSILKIVKVDGEVSLKSSPLSNLDIKTVYSQINFNPKKISPHAKLALESVSGDFVLFLPGEIEELSVETISGDLDLSVSPSQGWAYDLEGFYIRVSGFPENDAQSVILLSSLEGIWGPEPRAQLRYEALKGKLTARIKAP